MLTKVYRPERQANAAHNARELLIMKEHAQVATMDGQSAVVMVDKAMMPEPVHKVTAPGSGRADHLGDGNLSDAGDDSFSLASLAKMRKQQKNLRVQGANDLVGPPDG